MSHPTILLERHTMWEPKNIQGIHNYKTVVSRVPYEHDATAAEIAWQLDLSENSVRKYLAYAAREHVISCYVRHGTAYYRQRGKDSRRPQSLLRQGLSYTDKGI